jgi:hypothetical protein
MLIGTLALVVRRRRMVEQRYGSLAAMRVMMRSEGWAKLKGSGMDDACRRF